MATKEAKIANLQRRLDRERVNLGRATDRVDEIKEMIKLLEEQIRLAA